MVDTEEKSVDITLSFKTQFEENSTKEETTVLAMGTLIAPKDDESEKETRTSIDLMCAIDVSGSMMGEKLDLVKKTLNHMVEVLTPGDRFGIVSFSDNARLILPLLSMDSEGKSTAQKKILSLNIEGSTNISDALRLSIQNLISNNNSPNEVRSIILFTDGLANMGITNTEGILSDINKTKNTIANSRPKSKNSIFSCFGRKKNSPLTETSETKPSEKEFSIQSFGFGSDHDAVMLRTIAESKGGMYFFVENTDQISTLFANCLGGLVSCVASKIELEVESCSEVVISKVYSGFKVNTIENNKKYSFNFFDLQAEERRDVLFELKLPSSSETPDFLALKLSLSYMNLLIPDHPIKNIQLLAYIPRKNESNPDQTEDKEITENFMRFQSAEAIQKAMELGKKKDFEGAKELIAQVKQDITTHQYASNMDYLTNDLDNVIVNFSENEFESKGIYRANAIANSQFQQRSAGIGADRFATAPKKRMMSKFSAF